MCEKQISGLDIAGGAEGRLQTMRADAETVMPADTTGKQLYLAAMTPGFVRIAEKMPYR